MEAILKYQTGRLRDHAQITYRRARGAAIVETVIALPVLLMVILSSVQLGLIYEAKATLNYATLLAARSGAVNNASATSITNALARGLIPLYSPASNFNGITKALGSSLTDVSDHSRVKILNPTAEAFDDFGVDVDGEREIPNARLNMRSTELGAASSLNIQDANLLRVQATYGYELKVPLARDLFMLALRLTNVTQWSGAANKGEDDFETKLLTQHRLPIVVTSTVRMQTPARKNDLMVQKNALPDLARVAFNANGTPATTPPGEGADPGDGGSNSGEGGSGDEGPGDVDEGGGSSSSGGDAETPTDPITPGAGSGNAGSGGMCGGSDPNPFDLPTTTPNPNNSLNPSPPSPFINTAALPSLTVGNPIHVATGNKYQLELDLQLPGSYLAIKRHYNSSEAARFGVLGAGWRHDFEYALAKGIDDQDRWIWQADGRRVHFRKSTADAHRYDPERASDGMLTVTDAGTTWEWMNSSRLVFDIDGRLQSMRSAQSHLDLLYNQLGQLIKVIDERRHALSFDYYPNGRLAAVSIADRSIRYAYDNGGNLTEVSYPDKHTKHYRYEDNRFPHHLTAIDIIETGLGRYRSRAPAVHVADWEYDAEGRAVMSTHADDAGKVTLQFGDGYTDATDAFKRITRYHWERTGETYRIIAIDGPGCSTCGIGDVRYTYNDRHQVTAIMRKNGSTQKNIYDDSGRLTEMYRVRANATLTLVARYQYEGASRRITRIETPSINRDDWHTFAIRYTATGLPERIIERGFEPVAPGGFRPIEREMRLSYEGSGKLVAIDGPRRDANDVVRVEYDDQLRVARILSPDGTQRRVLAYTTSGLPLRVAADGVPDIEFGYDSMNRVISVQELKVPHARVVRYAYDIAGRIDKVTAPDGRELRLHYDAAGRPDAIGDSGRDTVQAFNYAADDRIVQTSTRDSFGQVLRTYYFSYDSQRRLREARDGSGPALAEYDYEDQTSRPTRIQNALGLNTLLAYDSIGRVTRETSPDGGVVRFDFNDEIGERTVIAANGAKTRYAYDDFGRRVREESDDRGTTRYAYDEAGNLIAKTDARNLTIRYEYDAANRLVRIIKPDDVTSLEYRAGLLTSVLGSWGREQYEYDARAQRTAVIRSIDGHAYSTRYAYDFIGRVSDMWLPDGQHLRYRYSDKGGQLTGITQVHWLSEKALIGDPQQRVHALPRTTQARVYQLVYGNGLIANTEIDPEMGNVQRKDIGGLHSLDYAYDEAGRIKAVKVNDAPHRYEYDGAGRLVGAQSPTLRNRYGYDTAGNRIWERTEPVQGASFRKSSVPSQPLRAATDRTYRYSNASHRLDAITGEHSVEYRYDAAGNPLMIGNKQYVYDSSGRPAKLFIDRRLVAQYRYSAMGERIAKTTYASSGAVTTYYLYEDHHIVAEADGRGRITRQYLYLGHHPVVALEGTTPYYLHTDHLGTPQVVTDDQRRTIWKADYEPFGAASVDEDPDHDGRDFKLNLRFPGQYSDAESGTHYNYFRDYDPASGRYVEPDPIGLRGGTNLFSYALNSPLIHTDSLGLAVELFARTITDTPFKLGVHTFLLLDPDDPFEVMEYLKTVTRNPDVPDYFHLNSPKPPEAGEDPWYRAITLSGEPHELAPNVYLVASMNAAADLPAGQYVKSLGELNAPTVDNVYGCKGFSADSVFIGNLLLAFESYKQTYPVGLNYDGLAGTLPELPVRGSRNDLPVLVPGVDYYNSNSMTAGLLQSAGFLGSIPDPDGFNPGLDKPVPIPFKARSQ